jgi:MraZ protein
VFQGSSQLTLDSKGRLSMPSRLRESLMAFCDGRVTVTRHLDKCLLIYPRPTWEAKKAELSLLPFEAREVVRMLTGKARDIDLDNAGRVLIPPELRDSAGLDRDVLLIGLGNYLELWDQQRRLEQEEATFADGIPEAAKKFTF